MEPVSPHKSPENPEFFGLFLLVTAFSQFLQPSIEDPKLIG